MTTWVDMRGPGNCSAYALALDSEHAYLYRGTDEGIWKHNGSSRQNTGGSGVGHLGLFPRLRLRPPATVRGHRCRRFSDTTAPPGRTQGGAVSGHTVMALVFDHEHGLL